MRKLLTVTETFAIRGRGVLVGPSIDAHEARSSKLEVELRTPNGERRVLEAYVQVPFVNPPPPVPVRDASVMLLAVDKADVPLGSEVWTAEPPRER